MNALFSVLSILAILSISMKEIAIHQIDDQVTFTVIYDNTSSSPEYEADWGFACLIEGKEKTILFDTGSNPNIFRENLEKLNIDLNMIDLVVISHNHGDHTGGLPVILEKRNDMPLYIPASVEDNFLARFSKFESQSIGVSNSIKLCDGAILTGEMGDRLKEQSLIIETPKGLVVVCGCSHQGVDNILKRTKELSVQEIYLLFGGFHLLRHSEDQVDGIINEFRKAGVKFCGATHCTGENAIEMFSEAYGDNFVPMGSGKKIVIP